MQVLGEIKAQQDEIRELWNFRELLWILVQRDLRVRYKNSKLGFGWSLVNPMVQVAVITVVLKFVLRVDIDNYSAYIFAAFLPWSFFQLTLLDASTCLLHHEGLLKKVYFPREVIPLAVVVSNLIHYLLATLVFLVYLTALPVVYYPFTGRFEWTIQWTVLLLPLAIVPLTLLTTGLAFIVASLNVFYEDVRYLLTNGLQVLYYLVPIIYFDEFVYYSNRLGQWREAIYVLFLANPLAALIVAIRKWILPPTTSATFGGRAFEMLPHHYLAFGLACLTSAAVAWLGYAYFNRRKWKFAERP